MLRPFRASIVIVGGVAWASLHVVAHRTASAPEDGHGAAGHASHSAGADPAYLTTSLALCFSLALALAAAVRVVPRLRVRAGRSLWLFGAVPLLGLLAAEALDAGVGLAPVDILPFAIVLGAVQLAVAASAVRVADRVLTALEGAMRALARPRAGSVAVATPFLPPVRAERARSLVLGLGSAPRAPPARAAAR